MKYLLLPIFLLFGMQSTFAQRSNDIKQAIVIKSEQVSETSTLLTWNSKPTATSYRILRRNLGELSFSVIPVELAATDTSFLLENVDLSQELTEIQVQALGGDFATGYLSTGFDYLPEVKERKLLVMIVDSLFDSINEELVEYVEVLRNELWEVEIETVSENYPPPTIKGIIKDKNAEKVLSAVLLIGHVAVPYAGNNAIDGHTSGNNHRGAWAADVYYGDLDGQWTDLTVNNEEATREANRNIPGDGKFDQNFIPSAVELAVGRIDFSDLPAFSDDEIALTRKYINKNIAYRTGVHKASNRGVIDNNFNLGEGFAQGAIKSFSSFMPYDSISFGEYSQAKSKDYLWTYGAGGGNYRGASGIINTNQLAVDSIQSIFTTLFGSYFGDWDNSNNLLRSSIASGTTLINAWSGRPIWQFHKMAMGSTVGEVLLEVQNNTAGYYSQFGNRLTHIALMGDPTLKMLYSKPVEKIQEFVSADSIMLTWENPADMSDLSYYRVLRVDSEGGIELLSDGIFNENSFVISCPVEGSQTYIIQPLQLIESPSGSYYNAGSGTAITIETPANNLEASFTLTGNGNEVILTNQSTGAVDYFWTFGDGTTSTEENPTHVYSLPGQYMIMLIATSECYQDTTTMSFSATTTSTQETANRFVKIYPNPVSEYLRIENATPNYYIVLDGFGRAVASRSYDGGLFFWNLSDLESGVYYIKSNNGAIGRFLKI